MDKKKTTTKAVRDRLAPKPRTPGRKIELDLPCRLNDRELLEKGDLVSKLHDDARALRMAKKAKTDELAGEIKAKEAALSALVSQIRTRSETRPVACVEEFVHKDQMVATRRLDTRQIVSTRTMTTGERQPGLFDTIEGGKAIEEKKAKAKKAKDAATEPAESAPAIA